jgi:RNA-directed DNA polymerase
MTDASTSENLSPELMKVVERAQREPEGRFHSLAHLIDVPELERAYHRIRKDGAVGVDGVTKEQYGQKLQENLESLHARLKAKQYRHQPIRRVHIPKDNGKTRPIGRREDAQHLAQQLSGECERKSQGERRGHQGGPLVDLEPVTRPALLD